MKSKKITDAEDKEISLRATKIMKNFQGTRMDSYACFLLVEQIKEALFEITRQRKGKR